MNYDWTAEPERPLSPEAVWALMTNGCNWAEIMAAGKVDAMTARGMMAEAARLHGQPGREVLRLRA